LQTTLTHCSQFPLIQSYLFTVQKTFLSVSGVISLRRKAKQVIPMHLNLLSTWTTRFQVSPPNAPSQTSIRVIVDNVVFWSKRRRGKARKEINRGREGKTRFINFYF